MLSAIHRSDIASMVFKDRRAAGELLVEKLEGYRDDTATVVVALPRGGVMLGRVVADRLRLPLDIIVPRKIGAEHDPEYAIGAVAESGEEVWDESERARADAAYLRRKVKEEVAEAKRRLATFRAGMPPRKLSRKTVIIVDDGMATGLTMRAAIATARKEKAKRIVLAVPVAPSDTTAAIAREVDEIVVLHEPALFFAIGGFYSEFPQVEDAAVVELLRKR